MGVTSSDGDAGRDFGVEETNIEKAENKASKKRGHQKFPMMLHKPQRLTKLVGTSEKADPAERAKENEAQLAAAVKAGWYVDVRDVPVDEDEDGVPDQIHLMTVDQAAAAIKKADAKLLAEYEADEQAHGNREPVVTLISDAKDRVASKAAKAKPAAAPKKPRAAKAKPE